ncbi:unnamed protein product [Alternaria alternata]
MAPSLPCSRSPGPRTETDSGLQTFLQKMSLRTGAEVITFLQVINKASGVYGLLALLTGAKIDGWQLSMYLYSTFALVATTFLYKHIRLQSPFESVLLAHLYALDSVINALYTAFFGIAWFYTLAAHPDENAGLSPGMKDNAGFTSPSTTSPVGQGADGGAGLGNAVFQSGSIMSISLISGFWALRVYFVFIMLAFARQCLRQHIAANASSARTPSAEGKEEGSGWKGKLGRVMLSGSPKYWLGADAGEGEDWMRNLGGRFKKTTQLDQPVGFNERERRRRAGTGPPVPQLKLNPELPK